MPKKQDVETFVNPGNDEPVTIDHTRESEPVYDPVEDYPPRPLAEATEGVRNFDPHDSDQRAEHVAVMDDYGNELPPPKGQIADVHDYVEGNLAPAGYVAPIYES